MYPKYQVPYDVKDPKRDPNFDLQSNLGRGVRTRCPLSLQVRATAIAAFAREAKSPKEQKSTAYLGFRFRV